MPNAEQSQTPLPLHPFGGHTAGHTAPLYPSTPLPLRGTRRGTRRDTRHASGRRSFWISTFSFPNFPAEKFGISMRTHVAFSRRRPCSKQGLKPLLCAEFFKQSFSPDALPLCLKTALLIPRRFRQSFPVALSFCFQFFDFPFSSKGRCPSRRTKTARFFAVLFRCLSLLLYLTHWGTMSFSMSCS